MIKRFILLVVVSLLSVGGLVASADQNSIDSIASSVCEGASAAIGSNVCTTSSTDQSNTTSSSSSTSSSTSNNSGTYAALGDSVAAGLGLAPVPNASQQDIQCGRSSQSYPYIVAQQANLRLVHVACSGATAGDLFTSEGALPPQLDQAFAQGTPQLITITAGANDVHWASFARACYATDCATDFNAGLARFYLVGLKAKLVFAFSSIQNRSNGNPPNVVITGYYNPVSDFCKNRQNFVTNAEIDFLNTQRDNLNATIRDAAASYPFVKYASADFTGHGLCSTDPWSQNINEAAPLHPNAQGQQHLAESVMAQVNVNR